ncbi:GMC family oxidoreductase N-terminal domain-containing protein [Jannaschia sp. Os4]|uniref:GMC family oxidoreductase n=1 Tax=Jannaschia sp. Os4 TaxID=2807617 RepID=UPI001939A2DF|nr:GMC family oxidoreductase N-terminal domain-containing protein [Jannaschia sp. Os4]MBM2577075.1 GMC family oxidoreductase N-terminal domain-containing protein [Jannaschia sp. Os4]
MEVTADVVVVGAGAAGAVLAGRLRALRPDLDVLVLEAGPTDRHPLVAVPFGLVWLMGSRRDWRYRTVPQAGLGGRRVKVPRGKGLGGSASINSMVWFRGRRDDFDHWGPGWGWSDVEGAFEAVEAALRPARLPDPHPLSEALERVHGGPVDPERVSSGVLRTNMARGRRHSPVRAFLRGSGARVLTGAEVERVEIAEGRARAVLLSDGRRVGARAGVVLAGGAIGSPAILMRSGVGPRAQLARHGIGVAAQAEGVGANLHDHPAVAVHHEGPGSGYGLTWGQMPGWAMAPLALALGRGRLTSNTVEAGAFLGEGDRPFAQIHFIPARLGHEAAIGWGAGYYADVCLMQPRSRGRLTLSGPRASDAPEIDFGLLADARDRADLKRALGLLRGMLDGAPFGRRRAPEVFPGAGADLDAHLDARVGTAYHPVGTVALQGPLDDRLAVRGVDRLWVADASVMPRITSANTNAPSMMIGYRGAGMVAEGLGDR